MTDAVVQLAIPAKSRYLRLARLTAAGIASDLGFSLQGVEDLRIAVDEACALLIEGCEEPGHDDGHQIELRYRIAGDKLLIDGTSSCGNGEPIEIHAVAQELLDMTAEEYEIICTDSGRGFRLVKHRQDAAV